MKKKLPILLLIGLGSVVLAQRGKRIKVGKKKPKYTFIQKSVKKNNDLEHQNLVQKNIGAINHLFNNEANKNKVFVSIYNASQCDIVVDFKGNNTSSLSVAPKKRNFIMLEKGEYTLSSDVCGAEYLSKKNLIKDLEISLKDE